LPKIDGGLGIRDLRLQNTCLLMKLVPCAHDAESSAWSCWLEMEFGGLIDAPEISDARVHLASLRHLLPDYRLLTTVEVGDGKNQCFGTTAGLLSALSLTSLFSHACRGRPLSIVS
jgi:hypothetical protein